MGKVAHKKHNGKRTNPTGVPSANDVVRDIATMHEEPSLMNDDSSVPVLDKLASVQAGDRAWACSAITNLIHDNSTRKLLLTKNLVSKLVSTLADQHLEVVMEATGTLRNLSIYDQSTCKEMYVKQIVPAMETLTQRLGKIVDVALSNASGNDKQDDIDRKLCYPLLEQLFGLMEACCECAQVFILALSKSSIVFPFIVEMLIRRTEFPQGVVRAGVSMLEALSEDNNEIIKTIPSAITQMLLNMTSEGDDVQTKSAAAGVIYNVRNALKNIDWVTPVAASLSASVQNSAAVLDATADYIVNGAASNSAAMVKNVMTDDGISSAMESVVLDKPTDQRFVLLCTQLQSLQTTFELLSNLTSHIVAPNLSDSDDEWQETETTSGEHNADSIEDGEEEEAEDEPDSCPVEIEEDMGQPGDELGFMVTDIQDEQLVEMVIHSRSNLQTAFVNLLPHIVSLGMWSLPLFDTSVVAFANVTYTIQTVTTVKIRALSVLNNALFSMLALPKNQQPLHPYPLLNLLPIEPTPRASVQQLFDSLTHTLQASLVTEINEAHCGVTLHVELLSMLIGCQWGLLKNFDSESDMGAANWTAVSSGRISELCASYYHPLIAGHEECQAKLVGLLGVLGRRQNAIEDNRHIAELFHRLLLTPTTLSPAVLSEVLNSVFDIYGDQSYDYEVPVFRALNFLDVLKNSINGIKQRVKIIDKRRQRELRARCEESLLNLREFIKYKANEQIMSMQ